MNIFNWRSMSADQVQEASKHLGYESYGKLFAATQHNNFPPIEENACRDIWNEGETKHEPTQSFTSRGNDYLGKEKFYFEWSYKKRLAFFFCAKGVVFFETSGVFLQGRQIGKCYEPNFELPRLPQVLDILLDEHAKNISLTEARNILFEIHGNVSMQKKPKRRVVLGVDSG